jgi:GT2 family glycosyltransferase
METQLTVAIPTYNRAALLRESLTSVLAQDIDDFQILALNITGTKPTSASWETGIARWN